MDPAVANQSVPCPAASLFTQITDSPKQLRRRGGEYETFFQQLMFISKDVIAGLTQITGGHLPYAEAIVTVFQQRVKQTFGAINALLSLSLRLDS